MNETQILENIAKYIDSNPKSDLKDKIDELFKLNRSINSSEAIDIINNIKRTLGLVSEPLPFNIFYESFVRDFNNAIKIKIADVFIKTPILYEINLIRSLNEVLDKIGFEKYYIIKKFLWSQGFELIDIKAIINSANNRLKRS